MIEQLARFAHDCYYVLKSPSGSKSAILSNLALPGGSKMGFQIAHFDRPTLRLLYREVFVRQHYFFRADSDSPVIFDCGANLGMASLYFKWLYPHARVQAFEPDPSTFRLLAENVASNHMDVEVHNCALWDQDGEVQFFVDSDNPGSLLMSTDPTRLKGESIMVPARRLSSFISGTVDFLKLDVEGAEARVLDDLVQTGKIESVKQMVVEYHHRIGNQKSALGDFLRLLEEAGFQYQIHASSYPVISKDTFQDILIGAYR